MCGRGKNDDSSKENIKDKATTTTTRASSKDPCVDYKFNSTECNIAIRGQLILVLDSINATFREYFSCFCKVVLARLNNTDVTTEILAGKNQSTCDPPNDQTQYVNQSLLQEKLMNLSKWESQDEYAGMAVVLTDRGFTSEDFSILSENKEPFLYFVNVGKHEKKNGSCYRQYRYVEDITDISGIGQELENIGCNNTDYMMNNNCIHKSSPGHTTPSAENQGNNLIVSIAVGGLLLAVLTIVLSLIYVQKCKRQEKPTKKP